MMLKHRHDTVEAYENTKVIVIRASLVSTKMCEDDFTSTCL